MTYKYTRKQIAKELRILFSVGGVNQVIWEPILDDLLAKVEPKKEYMWLTCEDCKGHMTVDLDLTNTVKGKHTMQNITPSEPKKECKHTWRSSTCADCGINWYSVHPTPSEPIKLVEIEPLCLTKSWVASSVNDIIFEKKINELIDWSRKVNKILKGK